MTRDDIIRMAREAWQIPNWSDAQLDRLEHFAALVAAAEREACAVAGAAAAMAGQDYTGVAAAIRTRGDKT